MTTFPCIFMRKRYIIRPLFYELGENMKENTHPEYREVVFVDMSTGKKFLCGSAVATTATDEYEGKTYPSVRVSISSSSHPFYTGDATFVDTEGRVDKFKNKYGPKVAAGKKKAEDKEEDSSKKQKK